MKKFELTDEFVTNNLGKKLFRIRALETFGDVKAGEVGQVSADRRSICIRLK